MRFIENYERMIVTIINATGGQDKVVHISAGLLIWIVSAIVLRTGLRSPWPLLPVFIAEAGNEIIDRISSGSWRWHDTIGDVIATILWPLVLCLAFRHVRSLRK